MTHPGSVLLLPHSKFKWRTSHTLLFTWCVPFWWLVAFLMSHLWTMGSLLTHARNVLLPHRCLCDWPELTHAWAWGWFVTTRSLFGFLSSTLVSYHFPTLRSLFGMVFDWFTRFTDHMRLAFYHTFSTVVPAFWHTCSTAAFVNASRPLLLIQLLCPLFSVRRRRRGKQEA